MLEKPLKKGVSFKDKTITIEQFKKFFSTIKQIEEPFLVLYFENMYLLALETGARINEIIQLKPENFNLETKEVRIIISKRVYRYEDMKPLSDALVMRLKKHLRQYSTEIDIHNYIFFSLQMQLIGYVNENTVRNHQKRILKKAGLFETYTVSNQGHKLSRFTFHSIRHLSGQVVCDKYGIYAAKNHLNHTNINSTLQYLDSNQERKKEIKNLFENVMDNDQTKDMLFQFINLMLQNKIINNNIGSVNDSNLFLGDLVKFFQKKN